MRKKVVFSIILFVIVLIGGLFIYNKYKENKLYSEYSMALNSVEIVSTEEVIKMKESNTPFFLLVGRKTCISCREFLPLLVNENKAIEKKIYYLDVEKNLKENREYAKKVLQVEFLPSFLLINKNGETKKYNYSIENETDEKERERIQEFLLQKEVEK